MKKSGVAAFGVIILLSILFLTTNVSAASKTAGVKAVIPPSVSLILSTDSMSFDLETPALYTKTMTITAKTNSPMGYTVSFNANNDYDELKHETEAITDKIPSISETTDSSAFPATGWAYSLESENFTFKQIPLEAKNIYATTTFGENVHIFTTGVRATGIVTGAYSNELIFTAVANPVPDTISTIVTMQEMDDDVCANSIPLETNQVIDSRDNKSYWITKLADGNCWMTQNLDFDLDSETTLTPADSDVKEDWTPLRSTIHGIANLDLTSWQNDRNTPYSFDPGDYYAKSGYRDEAIVCNYLNSNCDNFSTTAYSENGMHGHVGNYYNWTAAVAMNDTSDLLTAGLETDSSICPKGWRLPHGYRSAENDDFAALSTAYYDDDTDSKLIAAPVFTIRGGLISGGSLALGNYGGHYLTSTVEGYNDSGIMFVAAHSIVPSSANDRFYGQNVRCVARKSTKLATLKDNDGETILTQRFESGYKLPEGPEISGRSFLGWDEDATATEPTYEAGDEVTTEGTFYAIYDKIYLMQEISTWKNTLSVGQEIQAKDARDDKIYWVAKLADGNIWMTQNLDYDLSVAANRNLVPATSDVTTTRNLGGYKTTWSEHSLTDIYYLDGGDIYYANGNGAQGTYSTLPANSPDRHYHVGDFYSWYAAVAGQGAQGYAEWEANESICPAGWRLPGASEVLNDEPYSFGNLLKNYGNHSGFDENISDSDLLVNQPYFVHSGYVWNSWSDDEEDWGSEGDYWTNKTYDSSTAYALILLSNGVTVNDGQAFYCGTSIRCVAR